MPPKKPLDLTKVAKKAFDQLHKKGTYKPEDLTKYKAYRELITATSEVFNTAIPHEVPEEMRAYLEKDVFVFSGLKTHTQLTEARSKLKDEEGNIRPYYQFEQEILKLNNTYNRNYLEAEYQFAVQSAQSAANWANLQEDTSRYWLEYRTAGDERVRQSHAALAGICLPKDDAFWTEYYPPNGWRCRCTAVEVLARENTKSNPETAKKAGEEATTQIGKSGKNKLEMFRFNPGQEKKVFPPNNTYTKVVGATVVVTALAEIAKKSEQVRTTFEEVLSQPRQEQFITIYETDNGGKVLEHRLVQRERQDYQSILTAAKRFAEEGKIAEILPEINQRELNRYRETVFPDYALNKNPDLRIDEVYYDIKEIESLKTITRNANRAASQGSIAILQNDNEDINDIKSGTKKVFHKNNINQEGIHNYPYDVIYILHKEKLYRCNKG
nr:MAG TPA: minor capsid component [Caudoviricetes sp.]